MLISIDCGLHLNPSIIQIMTKSEPSQNPSSPTSSTPKAPSQPNPAEPPKKLDPAAPPVVHRTRFTLPEVEVKPPPRPSTSPGQRISGSPPTRPSTSTRPSSSGSGGRQSDDRDKRRSPYPEILSSPKHVKSLLDKPDFHLTWKIDNSYFSGRAGSLRILTLLLSVASFGFGLPGYSATPQLYVGYGASPLIPLSMALFSICILINMVMIILLLCFREVRCQSKWDDRNLRAFAFASAIAVIAGIIELGGIFHVRRLNCRVDPRYSCIIFYKDSIHKPTLPELNMSYKNWHYFSVCGKLLCAMSYSFCARIFLKNNDRLHSHHSKLKKAQK